MKTSLFVFAKVYSPHRTNIKYHACVLKDYRPVCIGLGRQTNGGNKTTTNKASSWGPASMHKPADTGLGTTIRVNTR